MMLTREILLKKAETVREKAVLLRREFHRIPELGFAETETTERICRHLRELGITPHPLEPTGVCAFIGPEEGYTIALRADIDGLPVTEKTGLSFASEHAGRMHACGHDGHIADFWERRPC